MRSTARAMRTWTILAVAIAASCTAPSVSPSPSPSAAATPSAPITASPATPSTTASSPGPSPSVGPTAPPSTATGGGTWQQAGTMAIARGLPHAVVLGDGSVLVIGADGAQISFDDSQQAEIWDPTSGRWSSGPKLNKPRADFLTARLSDGRVMVTGGVTAGVVDSPDGLEHHQSFSGTYIFDPAKASSGWVAVAGLAHARTAPAGGTLADGRVLVAGGYFLSGSEGAIPSTLAGPFQAGGGGTCPAGSCVAPPADVAPPKLVSAFATAEIYDPAKDAWTATGPMHYARVGAASVLLTDGRLLVVGSGSVDDYSFNYSNPRLSDRAYSTAETYDPASGRFTLTGDLPAPDWSPLAKLGPYPITSYGVTSVGTLAALADGGALLVGRVTRWSVNALDEAGTTVQTLRFDASSGAWSVVDQAIYGTVIADEPTPTNALVAGHSREGATAIRLQDGRVLIAGGTDTALSDAADLWDPTTGSWTPVAPMPNPHRDGTAVLLPDGSVLIAGGQVSTEDCAACAAIAVAVRFVPAP